jgi:hypothetical protein
MATSSYRISVNDVVKYIEKNIVHYTDEVKVLESDSEDEHKTSSHNFYPLKYNLSCPFKTVGNNLDDILSKINDDFNRMGVLTNIDELEDVDVSLYSSVFFCLKKGFSNSSRSQQAKLIKEFLHIFKAETQSNKFSDFGYKDLGWTPTHLMEDIKSGEVKTTVLRYLADFFHVNIFMLNMDTEELYYIGNDPWVSYKKNILLVRHMNGNFEPVYTDHHKTFSIGSKLVKFLMMKPHLVSVLYCDLNNKESKKFAEGKEKLSKYLGMENNDTVDEEGDEAINGFDDSTELSVHNDSDEDHADIQLMTEVYQDMKKDDDEELSKSSSYSDIAEIAQKQGIDLYYKKKGSKKKIKKTKEMLMMELEQTMSLDEKNSVTSDTDSLESVHTDENDEEDTNHENSSEESDSEHVLKSKGKDKSKAPKSSEEETEEEDSDDEVSDESESSEDASSDESESDSSDSDEDNDYDNMTVAQLRVAAKDRDINVRKNGKYLVKAELIKALKKSK